MEEYVTKREFNELRRLFQQHDSEQRGGLISRANDIFWGRGDGSACTLTGHTFPRDPALSGKEHPALVIDPAYGPEPRLRSAGGHIGRTPEEAARARPSHLIATITLSAAQLRALQATPITIVPAPGSGFMLVPFAGGMDYKFGTRVFGPGPGSITLFVGSGTSSSSNNVAATANSIRTATSDQTAIMLSPTGAGALASRSTYDNAPLKVRASASLNGGTIATSTVNSGGAGYVVGDTVESTDGGSVLITVDTVDGGGAVLTYTVTDVGSMTYLAGTTIDMGNNVAPQAGVGTGFAIDVATVDKGDGTLRVTIYYTTVALQ